MNLIFRVKELESLFSHDQYRGSGESAFIIEEGNIPILVSAPHAINRFRDGELGKADRYTGGIARYLHEATGCHAMYSCRFTESDPNYDEPETNEYQARLQEYITQHEIKFLIELHGASTQREYAVEMGTCHEDSSLHQYAFIAEYIRRVFERNFNSLNVEQKKVCKNVVFSASKQNTVTKYISTHTDTPCIQLEMNWIYRNPDNEEAFTRLVESLIEIIRKGDEQLS